MSTTSFKRSWQTTSPMAEKFAAVPAQLAKLKVFGCRGSFGEVTFRFLPRCGWHTECAMADKAESIEFSICNGKYNVQAMAIRGDEVPSHCRLLLASSL